MITVGVRELKANLSRYIRQVQEQQTGVSVTARGKAVARLVPAAAAMVSARDILDSLASHGLMELPREPRRGHLVRPIVPKAGGKPLSEMIVEDRR